MGRSKKKKIELGISFFGTHVMTLVRMCGFEGSNHVDLRANFRIFADTKWKELPGACDVGILTPTSILLPCICVTPAILLVYPTPIASS